jgi:ketosteroid isomerase-like protein
MRLRIYLALILLTQPVFVLADELDAVSATLDSFHAAAARGDTASYLELLAPEVVFLGTDGSERWQGQDFRDFVKQIFANGSGWTYLASDRRVTLSGDGRVAWFDEALENQKLGSCRGSGVLVHSPGGWRLAQYNLSVPIPNSMVLAVAEDIAGLEQGSAVTLEADSGQPEVDVLPQPEEEKKNCGKRFKTNRKADC